MTNRRPLAINRLTPLQLGLTAATLLLLFGVVALIFTTFSAANTARSAFEGGYVMTDLANIQRSVFRLHLATHTVMNNPGSDWTDLEMEQALLTNQLLMARGEAADNPGVIEGIDRLTNILDEYAQALTEIEQLDRPNQPRSPSARLDDILVRLEHETQWLYDQEETRFFGRISRALNHQRTSQIILLAMVSLSIFFGVTLATSLRRSVGQEFERAYNMLEALYGADEELHRHLRIERVFQALVDVVVDIFGAQKSALMIWDPDAEQLVACAARGYNDVTLQAMRFRLNEGLVGEAATHNRAVVVEDAYRDPRASRRIIIPENIRAFMHVPIEISGQVYGVLSVCFSHPRSFDSDDLRLVRAFSHRAASAIENARLYQQVEESATTEERQRLARELHDAVTQTLFSASLIAEVLPRIWERSPEMGRQRLDELRELTRGALAEMRTLLLELRPSALIDTQLGDLLVQLGEAVTGRARLPVHVEIVHESECEIPPDIKVAVYRIAQEALNNVSKHARATQATMRLACSTRGIHLSIQDDGQGFDVASIPANHLGLGIMRDRASAIDASLDIESAPGQGTRIDLVWPKRAAEPGVPGNAVRTGASQTRSRSERLSSAARQTSSLRAD